MEGQLNELINFLSSPRPDVRQLAATYIVDFSHPSSDSFKQLVGRADQLVKPLLVICHEEPVVAHKAMNTLVNLSTDHSVCRHFADEDILAMVVRMITSPSCFIADPACMLLSNLTKLPKICELMCTLETGLVPGICNSQLALDQLTDVFVKGMDKKYNKHAKFSFLASVFADITNCSRGRRYFLRRTDYDGRLPITKIMVFNEYPDVIRRGGVDSTMKNVCFEKDKHKEILDPQETNMLPYILLPLCGPEEFDIEDMDNMPEEVQFLGDEKKREPDPKLRSTLLEALNLLCTTYYGRQTLRDRNVYPILREMHKAETDETCIELNERAVQLIKGEESEETKRDASPQADAIEEI
ncbi:Protein hgh1 [Coemansia sp. RSA 552]|nr:Protein hgh1 [Coemansia sp. RSA 552]